MRGTLISKLVQEAMSLVESDLEMIHGYASVFLPLISTKRILKSQNFDLDQTKIDLKEIIDKHIFEKMGDNDEQSSLELRTSTVNNISIQSTNDGILNQS